MIPTPWRTAVRHDSEAGWSALGFIANPGCHAMPLPVDVRVWHKGQDSRHTTACSWLGVGRYRVGRFTRSSFPLALVMDRAVDRVKDDPTWVAFTGVVTAWV